MPLANLRDFFKMEAAGGIVLAAAAVLAVIVANTGLQPFYQMFLDMRLEIRVGPLELAKPLLLWINDGLMAVFFFLIGLEIKREFLEGELSSASQAVLPVVAAVGGMAAPALIYVAINLGNTENLAGWAIPAATDIAFALGLMAALGKRVPLSLKVLLTAIAVFDDLGAIVIIAGFYTHSLSMEALAAGGIALAVLVGMNLARVARIAPYIIVGVIMWICVLKSGVHATIAGVLLGLTIPMRSDNAEMPSPLRHLEHTLHPYVAFLILPVFAFANAGVSFAGIGLDNFVEPVKLGVSAGLFIGKQVGVFGLLYLMVRFGLAPMPAGARWIHLYGVALMCGIGFTMSLFIGGLAWEHADFEAPVRLGVITGSLLSALAGYLVLRLAPPAQVPAQNQAPTPAPAPAPAAAES